MAGAVAATLFLVSRPLGWCATLTAMVMAFARVYVAEAYPFDALAGLVEGAAVSLIGYLLVRRVAAPAEHGRPDDLPGADHCHPT
jgi:hypothetical protein